MSLYVMPLSNIFSTNAELHVPLPAGLTRGQGSQCRIWPWLATVHDI